MRFSPRQTSTMVLVLGSVCALMACAGGPAAAGPISVEQLLARSADTPVSVTGLLYDASTGTRLCGAVMESFPVQCGKPFVDLVGLDIATIAGTTTEQGITWKEGIVLSVERTDTGSFAVIEADTAPGY